jgi:hypothetical protein
MVGLQVATTQGHSPPVPDTTTRLGEATTVIRADVKQGEPVGGERARSYLVGEGRARVHQPAEGVACLRISSSSDWLWRALARPWLPFWNTDWIISVAAPKDNLPGYNA